MTLFRRGDHTEIVGCPNPLTMIFGFEPNILASKEKQPQYPSRYIILTAKQK
jgi:hypothetical protein